MQKIAAYLLERCAGLETPEARITEVARCEAVFRQWLQGKGAEDPSASRGTYHSEDGGQGSFRWDGASDDNRSWKLLRLDETAADETQYGAAVSVTDSGSVVAVYVSVEAGLNFSTIKPVHIDPRCPRVVRSLLDMGGDWFHGSSKLAKMQRLTGTDAGESLAAQIAERQRTVPIVVVSEDAGAPALPGLDKAIAYDLEGLANTFVVDNAASWGLTYALGRYLSCFSGAVRIYWPRFSTGDNPFHHPLWTAARLQASSDDVKSTLESFRRQLRQTVMQASARSVLRPREIDEIQGAAKKRHLDSLMQQAESGADYHALAITYAEDNDALRAKADHLSRQIDELTLELEDTRLRLENAELIARYQTQPEPAIAPLGPLDSDAEERPQEGEVRFYKKKFSAEKFDILVRVADCGDNTWQSAAKAEKAKKGVERLEGRNDWKVIQHCGKCTGGGVWRVKW